MYGKRKDKNWIHTREITNKVAKETGISQIQARDVCEAFMNQIAKELAEFKAVSIRGWLKLENTSKKNIFFTTLPDGTKVRCCKRKVSFKMGTKFDEVLGLTKPWRKRVRDGYYKKKAEEREAMVAEDNRKAEEKKNEVITEDERVDSWGFED